MALRWIALGALMGVGPIYFWRLTTETEIWDFGLLKEAHIGGQTILKDLTTSVEQTSWGQVKTSLEDMHTNYLGRILLS